MKKLLNKIFWLLIIAALGAAAWFYFQPQKKENTADAYSEITWQQPVWTSNENEHGRITASSLENANSQPYGAFDGWIGGYAAGVDAGYPFPQWFSAQGITSGWIELKLNYQIKISKIEFYNGSSGGTDWTKGAYFSGTDGIALGAPFTAVNANRGKSTIVVDNILTDTIRLNITSSYGSYINANEIKITATIEYFNYTFKDQEGNILRTEELLKNQYPVYPYPYVEVPEHYYVEWKNAKGYKISYAEKDEVYTPHFVAENVRQFFNVDEQLIATQWTINSYWTQTDPKLPNTPGVDAWIRWPEGDVLVDGIMSKAYIAGNESAQTQYCTVYYMQPEELNWPDGLNNPSRYIEQERIEVGSLPTPPEMPTGYVQYWGWFSHWEYDLTQPIIENTFIRAVYHKYEIRFFTYSVTFNLNNLTRKTDTQEISIQYCNDLSEINYPEVVSYNTYAFKRWEVLSSSLGAIRTCAYFKDSDLYIAKLTALDWFDNKELTTKVLLVENGKSLASIGFFDIGLDYYYYSGLKDYVINGRNELYLTTYYGRIWTVTFKNSEGKAIHSIRVNGHYGIPREELPKIPLRSGYVGFWFGFKYETDAVMSDVTMQMTYKKMDFKIKGNDLILEPLIVLDEYTYYDYVIVYINGHEAYTQSLDQGFVIKDIYKIAQASSKKWDKYDSAKKLWGDVVGRTWNVQVAYHYEGYSVSGKSEILKLKEAGLPSQVVTGIGSIFQKGFSGAKEVFSLILKILIIAVAVGLAIPLLIAFIRLVIALIKKIFKKKSKSSGRYKRRKRSGKKYKGGRRK